MEFARERDALDVFGELRQVVVAPSEAPKELGPAYARLTSVPHALSPLGELGQLRSQFEALVESHLTDAPPARSPRASDLRSYLPLTCCTPFATAKDGDIFFLCSNAREAETGELVVLRLFRDDAATVHPWARTIGEHLALVALEAWGHREGQNGAVTKRLWNRRVRVRFVNAARDKAKTSAKS